jgi:hypothetical protein
MENSPATCVCGHKVGDGTHLLVCKKVNAGQIAAHDVAVRMIGAELNSYGVVVKYEQRANHVKEEERKRTDMEIWFDGRSMALDYTVPNTLNLKQRTPGRSQIRSLRSAECSSESQDQQVCEPREEQKS